jgi:peptidoglycan/LPS O-acetylase OafA/YrhL
MKRLYSLDALRGLAALSVVLWHWQHFYAMRGTWQAGWNRAAQPFYALLQPFYLVGWVAVDLFFALSGFVFFWLYAQAIAAGQVKAWRFAVLRFSRLYPLHFLTLLLVLVLQSVFHAGAGVFFIFDAGSWGRLAANLFLVQQWLPPTVEQTFNGPAWTVSIEAGLYVLFFGMCRLGLQGVKSALAAALAGTLLLSWNEFIARGLMGFFLGGIAYYAVERLRHCRRARAITFGFAGLALLLWGAALIDTLYGPLHAAAYWLSGHLSSEAGRFYIGDSDDLFLIVYIFSVVPVSIVALALSETVLQNGALNRAYERLSKLGDISFSTYMLHFPLQLTFVLVALHFGLTTAVFENGWTMFGFYAVLLGFGALSYHYYEKPVQRLIRGLIPPAKAPSA